MMSGQQSHEHNMALPSEMYVGLTTVPCNLVLRSESEMYSVLFWCNNICWPCLPFRSTQNLQALIFHRQLAVYCAFQLSTISHMVNILFLRFSQSATSFRSASKLTFSQHDTDWRVCVCGVCKYACVCLCVICLTQCICNTRVLCISCKCC